jgi:hypothetical protein
MNVASPSEGRSPHRDLAAEVFDTSVDYYRAHGAEGRGLIGSLALLVVNDAAADKLQSKFDAWRQRRKEGRAERKAKIAAAYTPFDILMNDGNAAIETAEAAKRNAGMLKPSEMGQSEQHAPPAEQVAPVISLHYQPKRVRRREAGGRPGALYRSLNSAAADSTDGSMAEVMTMAAVHARGLAGTSTPPGIAPEQHHAPTEESPSNAEPADNNRANPAA